MPVSDILNGLGLLILGVYGVCGLMLIRGSLSLKALKATNPASDENSSQYMPRVSVLIPACNEAETLEPALETVMRLNYPDLEVIVIEDRSTDDTPKVLDRLTARWSALKTFRIDALPSGWLGKNHALFQGAHLATGDLLLFTDADIHFHPDALLEAVREMDRQPLDHLTVIPELVQQSTGLHLLNGTFFACFNLKHRPWEARNPKSPYFMGVGAFNLIRKSVYDAIGTHRAIAMRPDDDMRLGWLVKRHGFHQDVLLGTDRVQVAWYPNAMAFLNGLMKNTFAFMNYSLLWVLISVAGLLLFNVFPFAALILQCIRPIPNLLPWLYPAIILMMGIAFIINARSIRCPAWSVFGFLPASLAFCWVLLGSAFLTLRRKGIVWRGTFYSLDELKHGGLPEADF